MHRAGISGLLLAFASVLSSCGGGGSGGSGTESTPPSLIQVARIEIAGGALLSGVGSERQLSALITDSAGHGVSTPLTWTSSAPSAIAVDASGKVHALVPSGSAFISASAGGVSAEAVSVLVTALQAQTTVINDSHIASDPAPVDSAVPYGPGFRFSLQLRGVPTPLPGALILSEGKRSIAGRVVSSSRTGEISDLTLEAVALVDAFPNLELDDSFSPSPASVSVNAELTSFVDIVPTASGEVQIKLKPNAVLIGTKARAAALTTSQSTRVGPFQCEGTPTGLQITMSALEMSASLSNLTFHRRVSGGFVSLSWTGPITVSTNVGSSLNVGAQVSTECLLKFFEIAIPAGPLSAFMRPRAEIGLKMGIKSTLPFASGVKVEAKYDEQMNVNAGVSCLSIICVPNLNLTSIAGTRSTPSTSLELISPTTTRSGVEVTAAAAVAFKAAARFDVRDITLVDFGGVDAGIKLSMKRDSDVEQIRDSNFASGYDLGLFVTGSVLLKAEGNAALWLFDILRMSNVELLTSTHSINAWTSPKGQITTRASPAAAGGPAAYNVTLDASTLKFLGVDGAFEGYNVERVVLYGWNAGNLNSLPVVLAVSLATPGQTNFSFTPNIPADLVSGKVYALVVTKAFGLPFRSLEIASTPILGSNDSDPPFLAELHYFNGGGNDLRSGTGYQTRNYYVYLRCKSGNVIVNCPYHSAQISGTVTSVRQLGSRVDYETATLSTNIGGSNMSDLGQFISDDTNQILTGNIIPLTVNVESVQWVFWPLSNYAISSYGYTDGNVAVHALDGTVVSNLQLRGNNIIVKPCSGIIDLRCFGGWK